MIAFIDRQIGRVLNALEENGRLERTTVLFSADHGDLLGDYGMWGKGNSALGPHLDIPLLIANHPALPRGARSGRLANNLDIPGTVLDIADADRGIGLSRSLVDLARPESRDPRTVNFSEFGNTTKIVEDRDYRYAYYPLAGEGELFAVDAPGRRLNIDADPRLLRKAHDMQQWLLDFEAVNNGLAGTLGRMVAPMGARLREIHPGYAVRSDPDRLPSAKRRALRDAGLDGDYTVVAPE
jgi:arylsulfatase A-like enzyme